MNNIFLYPHLEMGDNIICNGLIRELCRTNDHYLLATRIGNADSIKFMYRDLANLEIICIKDTYELPYKINECQPDKFLKIGHGLIDISKHFDEGFYLQHKIQFEKRWESFYVKRDEMAEQNLFEKFNIQEKYAFVHEDVVRNMKITKPINPSLRIIKVDKNLTANIFNYLKLIENATEIHVIPSSFLFLVDSFNFKGEKFLHKYSRFYPHHGTPSLKFNWKELQ